MNPTMQDILRRWLLRMDFDHIGADQLARALVDHFDIQFKEAQ